MRSTHQRGFGWVGKTRTLRAKHLGSSPVVRKSPLVGILSGVDPPHGRCWCCWCWDWPRLSTSNRHLFRECNITIKAPIFVFQNILINWWSLTKLIQHTIIQVKLTLKKITTIRRMSELVTNPPPPPHNYYVIY